MSEELDAMLRAYLQREQVDPIRSRLEKLSEWQLAHDTHDAERFGKVDRTLDGHNYRLTGLEQKADKLEEAVEDTASHDVSALRRKSDRIDSTVFRVVVGVLLILVGAGTYAAVHDIAGGHTVQLPIEVK